MQVSCFLAQESLALLSSAEEKEQLVLLCTCDVDPPCHIMPLETEPSRFNSDVKLFLGEPASSMKGTNWPVHTVL